MYNVIIFLYLCGVAIVSLFSEKVRKMWRGEREAIRVIKEKMDPDAKYVWFHAASLGEFEQGRPLMEQLRSEHPEYKILLTFFSPSGYEVRKNYEGADIICYLPLDTITNARRFLRTIRPVMAFFIKYEFWYNYLHILSHRGVPVYSVSSIFRPGQVFFRWYGRQYSHVLKCFTHFFVQNEISKELLATIGITNVSVTLASIVYCRLRLLPSSCLLLSLSAIKRKYLLQVAVGNPMRRFSFPGSMNIRTGNSSLLHMSLAKTI